MNTSLEHWLADSIGTLESLEREVNGHHHAIQQAMAEVRRREAVIERLERNISVIRRATNEIDTYGEDAPGEDTFERRFEQEFEHTFETRYAYEEVEAADSLEYFRMNDDDSNVVHVRPQPASTGTGARLPPPPPGLRTSRAR